mgnify:CR=1 FL=1
MYSLAEDLRSRDDAALSGLLAVRPDLMNPLPADFSSLAARANSAPSLIRSVESLNKWQNDLLVAASILEEPFSVKDLLAITDKGAKEEIEELWKRALLYKDDDGYRIPTNLRNLIGDSPAGLGPSTKKKLTFSELIKAPKGVDELLSRLMWGPPRGQVPNVKKPSAPVAWLLERGFLEVIDSQNVVLPREVALHLRGGKVFKEIITEKPPLTGGVITQPDIDRAAIANISTVLRWCEELAHHWSDEPPAALRAGGLGLRDLKRSAEHLGVEEICAAFVAELLYLAGLIAIDTDDQILPTNAFDLWVTKSHEDRWFGLVALWLETSRVAGLIEKTESKPLGPELDRAGISILRKSILHELSLAQKISPELSSFERTLKWLMPARFNNDYLRWTLREAEWLGLTGRGALSSFGLAFLSKEEKLGIEDALPRPVDHILIQADNSAIAPGPLTIEIANVIGTIADIESRGGATVYRFSESSIRRGLDHGRTGDQILDFLKEVSKTPIPQPLEYLILDVAKRHGRLRVGMASSYLRCEDEGLLTQILHDKKVDSLRLRKLAPQVLIAESDLHESIAVLREAGYLPAAENATGVLLSAPALRRAKSRPRPPRIISEFTSPTEGVLKSAVRALRAGEKATAHKKVDVPRTSANETLDLLEQYIEEQASLTIGYADTNGGVTNKVIDPLSISLGTLLARDHATGEVATFRISRITGVSPIREGKE